MTLFRFVVGAAGAGALSAMLAGCAAPNAAPDTATVTPGGSTKIDVLANDSSPNDNPLIIKRAWGAEKGDVQINPDNTITYNARSDQLGTDEFRYRVKDNQGHAKDSTVVVRIEPKPVRTTNQITVVPVPVPAPVTVHATPEPRPLPTGSSITPPPPPPGTPTIQGIQVILHTTDDDKNRDDSVRVVLRRDQEVVADRTFGTGELWGSDSDRSFEIPVQPAVPITEAGLLNLDVHKPPVGPGPGAGWAMQVQVLAHLSDGRTITLLPQTQPMKLGDGQPTDRSWTVPAVK
jgi:hypothetical protein